MFKNFPIAIGIKTAFRNLKRNKSYALINTLGLAVGIGACFLIFLMFAVICVRAMGLTA